MTATAAPRPARPRVVYWNSQASPYFVRRMNAVHDRGNVEVEAWLSELRSPDRDWRVDPASWRFPARVLPGGARRAAGALRLLGRARPDVLVTLYADAAFASVVLAAKAVRVPVVIHAMRTFSSWRPRSWVREAAKHGLFRLVDGVQVSGPDSRSYALGYGARPRRVTAIREEIDLSFWLAPDPGEAAVPEAGGAGCRFLYVGRLWRGKGLDHLLDAYAALRSDVVDCSLVLVGTGEEEPRLRARAAGLPDVAFAGHAEGDALRAWYRSADAFVFPTLGDPYGYVVEEAMASGLPVVVTTAAGDIGSRVRDGESGLVVEPGDTRALAERMRMLARDAGLRSRLGAAGRERVAAWSTADWAERFEAMIAGLVEGGR